MEIGSVPVCFDECIQEVETGSGLTSDEKNCMRECYLKRVSSREDFGLLMTQMQVKSTMKAWKDTFT
jgi:hypothetical protein